MSIGGAGAVSFAANTFVSIKLTSIFSVACSWHPRSRQEMAREITDAVWWVGDAGDERSFHGVRA